MTGRFAVVRAERASRNANVAMAVLRVLVRIFLTWHAGGYDVPWSTWRYI
jgi:hypothetical protein